MFTYYRITLLYFLGNVFQLSVQEQTEGRYRVIAVRVYKRVLNHLVTTHKEQYPEYIITDSGRVWGSATVVSEVLANPPWAVCNLWSLKWLCYRKNSKSCVVTYNKIMRAAVKKLLMQHFLCKNYNIKMLTNKTKVVAFKGRHPVRSKVIIDDKPVKQI